MVKAVLEYEETFLRVIYPKERKIYEPMSKKYLRRKIHFTELVGRNELVDKSSLRTMCSDRLSPLVAVGRWHHSANQSNHYRFATSGSCSILYSLGICFVMHYIDGLQVDWLVKFEVGMGRVAEFE